MDKVSIVTLSPDDRDNYEGLLSFYRGIRDPEKMDDIQCQENIDLEVYSDKDYNGRIGNGPIYRTDLFVSMRKLELDLYWNCVTVGALSDRDTVHRLVENCDFLLIFVSCKALSDPEIGSEYLTKVIGLMHTALPASVRFVFLDADCVTEDTLSAVLSKFGFKLKYRNRSTEYTCVGNLTGYARDVVLDSFDALLSSRSPDLAMILARRRLRNLCRN